MVIKVPSSNVGADMCSPDSLSLTSLVCTQQHSSKPPQHHRKTTKLSENDINFEFSYSAQSPAAVNFHKKSPSSDLFDLKLSPQPQVPGNITIKEVLEGRNRSRQSARNKETRNTAKKVNYQVGKYENGEDNSGGFAHKLVQSITTPCRSCSAVQPSVNLQMIRSSVVYWYLWTVGSHSLVPKVRGLVNRDPDMVLEQSLVHLIMIHCIQEHNQ